MKMTKKLSALLLASALLLCSCSQVESNNKEEASGETVLAEFESYDFKKIICETLDIAPHELTKKDLEQISGLNVYYYAERIADSNEYKPVWSVTVKKEGFDEVFDKYYNTPKEEREGLESPSDYSYNKQLEEFDGYEDIKLLKNLREISLNSEYMLIEEDPVKYFTGLTKLEDISLYNYAVPDLEDIGNFTELRNLGIGINLRNIPDGVEIEYIEDLTPLKTLTKLESLSLSGNIISDLSPITGLDSITDLSITNAALGDISPVAEMKNLKSVTFYYNGIEDVTPLTKIAGLEIFNLDYNYIQDVSPFANLDPNIVKYVSLDMNSISDDTPLKHLGKEKVNLGYDPYWDLE